MVAQSVQNEIKKGVELLEHIYKKFVKINELKLQLANYESVLNALVLMGYQE
ncbi:MAG: pyruvate formate-lyase activating enzyme-like uncharacterized protein [Colwellia sp.]|jgi:pyruvate formate-lyase activating enzyme-like uncharacterized protein